MQSIVLPTDFSAVANNALPWAADIADKFGASIHCIYVVEQPQVYSAIELGAAALPSTGDLIAGAQERLDQFAAEHLLGKDVTTKALSGHPADEIVDYANKVDAGMIVISTHGYRGVKHLFLGSTTEAVLRAAHCPVLAVRS